MILNHLIISLYDLDFYLFYFVDLIYPDLPMDLGSVNLHRIPPKISKTLIDTKEQILSNTDYYDSVENNFCVIPIGYNIIQYFGGKIFECVRDMHCTPMVVNGVLNSPHGQIGTCVRTYFDSTWGLSVFRILFSFKFKSEIYDRYLYYV